MSTKVIYIKDIFFNVVITEFYTSEVSRDKSRRIKIDVKDYDDRGRIRANVYYNRKQDLTRFTDFLARLEGLHKRAHTFPAMLETLKGYNRTISMSEQPKRNIEEITEKRNKLLYDLKLMRLII